MSRNTKQLLKAALELPEGDRVELAYGILDSVEFSWPTTERDEREWLGEIERRARAALAGEPGIPWEEARSAIESQLRPLPLPAA